MLRLTRLIALPCCALLAAAAIWGAAIPVPAFAQQQGNEAKQLFVQVASAKLRLQPKHWSPGTIDLSFGQQLVELSRDGGWLRVRTSEGKEGFVHESAVTARKVILASSSGNVNVQADESDVVLAGKGFSKELESGLSSTRKDLNFSEVDALLKSHVSDLQLAQFVKAGKLKDS